MNVPDKAVEAAAQAVFEEFRIDLGPLCFEWPKYFKDLPEEDQKSFLSQARCYLEAAAPFMEAAALHEQARTWGTTLDQYGRSIASHIHRDARVAEYGTDAT